MWLRHLLLSAAAAASLHKGNTFESSDVLDLRLIPASRRRRPPAVGVDRAGGWRRPEATPTPGTPPEVAAKTLVDSHSKCR